MAFPADNYTDCYKQAGLIQINVFQTSNLYFEQWTMNTQQIIYQSLHFLCSVFSHLSFSDIRCKKTLGICFYRIHHHIELYFFDLLHSSIRIKISTVKWCSTEFYVLKRTHVKFTFIRTLFCPFQVFFIILDGHSFLSLLLYDSIIYSRAWSIKSAFISFPCIILLFILQPCFIVHSPILHYL